MQYGVAIVTILIVAAAATIIKMSTGYYGCRYIFRIVSVLRIEPVLCTEILRLSRSVE